VSQGSKEQAGSRQREKLAGDANLSVAQQACINMRSGWLCDIVADL
jgi:hypothetical protein